MSRSAKSKKLRSSRQPQGDDILDPYRNLAARVIVQAWRDLFGGRQGPGLDRESAREFLSGSPMLGLWCGLAGFDAVAVCASAQSRLHPGRRIGATRRIG
jgi:hypothetical protein